MRAGGVSIQDVIEEGYRLTGAFHITEDRLAIATLRKWRETVSRVGDLVSGRGIFRGPIFSRMFVDDPSLGEPYVSAKDIVNFHVSPAGYLSRKHGSLLDDLRLHEGMILVTCSGMNLGKAIWARRDLDGLVASHDLIRIMPNPQAAPPGYLYAFLASRYGHALIRKQIYGGNIKHVEPEHISALLVPRLGRALEQRTHDLVSKASHARSEAVTLFAKADEQLIELLRLPTPRPKNEYGSPPTASANSSQFQRRGDAYYYAPLNTDARKALDSAGATTTVEEVADVFIPGIFKRQYANDPAFGVPYITGADVFELAPKSDRFLLTHIASGMRLVLRKGMIVIQEAGQLGGLVGHSALVGDHLDGFACSNNMVRVTAKDANNTGYLFAVLASTYGVRLLSREAAGSSIPHLEAGRVRRLAIPWPEDKVRAHIGELVMEASRLRGEATLIDSAARILVEDSIEQGASP
jgi:type I restriction enzyme, S subunit